MDLKDIVELCFAHTLSETTVGYLAAKIRDHKQLYKILFPDKPFKPKHHYIEHYPELIREQGPLVHVWTMRFEAKHSWFKGVVRESRCFKNILKTLAEKHQLMVGYFLSSPEYLIPDMVIKESRTCSLRMLDSHIKQLIQSTCDYACNGNVLIAASVVVCGTEYAPGMVIVTGSQSCLPAFSLIVHIALISGVLFFVAKSQKSWFCEHVRGFIIHDAGPVTLIKLSDLLDYYPLVPYQYKNEACVMLKHHVSVL